MPFNNKAPYVRICHISWIETDQMDEALRRLATVIREEASSTSNK